MTAPQNPTPRDPELDALLGAYALDALEDDERARVEAYIATNRLARNEVDELLESAASLALAPVDNAVASPELWDRIASNLDGPTAEADNVVRPSFWRRPAFAIGLAAAALIAIVSLTAEVVVLNDRTTGGGDLAAAFDDAAGKKGAREVPLAQPDGAQVARAVVLPDGTGYLRNESMAPLPAGKTYQLWALTGPSTQPVAISAGVLGSDPRTVAFHTTGDLGGLGVTVEATPGAVQPTPPIYASATIGA